MNQDIFWMREALAEAEKALQSGELPVGAVIVSGGADPVARSRAADFTAGNLSSHAEIGAILGANLNAVRVSGLTIYTTLEPCVMCAAAILIEGFSRVVYSLEAPQDGGSFIFDDPRIRSRCFGAGKPEIKPGILREEASDLFMRYSNHFPERKVTAEFARLVVEANNATR